MGTRPTGMTPSVSGARVQVQGVAMDEWESFLRQIRRTRVLEQERDPVPH